MGQPMKWNDTRQWGGVMVGFCTHCNQVRVTRNGLCWNCEHNQEPIEADPAPKFDGF